MMRTRSAIAFLCGLLILPLLSSGVNFAFAQSDVQKLQSEIQKRNEKLRNIEADIARYEASLQEVGAKKSTLQNEINRLNIERKKILADISYTDNKISKTDLEIRQLNLEIESTEESIRKNKEAIQTILQKVDKVDNESMIEVFLRQENLSGFWKEFKNLEDVRTKMFENITKLNSAKKILQNKIAQNTQQKESLLKLKNQYDSQQTVLAANKADKAQLLSATKNEEAAYQQQLKEKEKIREEFEQELRELESKLQFILNPNTIPSAGTEVFAWPLQNFYISQYFGDTAFARSGAYNGKGHNGMDLAAPRGTPVSAVLSGTVIATNVQTAYMCQYGKWVLVRHANGLTTLYAHMSAIAVNTGDTLKTGDVLGYVGSTGYSTGPHLHLTTYASEAVSFKQYTCNSGATLTIPVSAFSGYLNALDYLPPL